MKERIYYEINEQSARTAHEMMSMQEYKEGSKTREYRNLVDNAYDLAGQVEEKRPLQDETIHKIKAEGACCTLCAMKMNMK